jgi:MFS family permease
MSGLGGILFGGLADRFGRRRVMVWTILIYSLGTGLSALSLGVLSLMAFRAITGFGVGGEWATGHALMAEIFPKEKRGRASALLQAGEPLGVALAVLAGLWLAPRLGPHGWRWVFAISALPAFLVLLVRRVVPESPIWLARRAGGAPGFVEQYRILWRDHRGRALQGWILGATKLGTYWLTYVWLPEYFAEIGRGQEGGGSFARIRLTFILVAQGGQLVVMMIFVLL